MQKFPSLESLKQQIGQEVAVSDWVLIDQKRIDGFAAATGDRQWIHVDPGRCEQEEGIGCTIAHGFLTLSLISSLMQQSIEVGGLRLALNYGLNRVRFPAPVPVGSRLRARFHLESLAFEADAAQAAWRVALEREDAAKPVCTAEFVVRYYPATASGSS